MRSSYESDIRVNIDIFCPRTRTYAPTALVSSCTIPQKVYLATGYQPYFVVLFEDFLFCDKDCIRIWISRILKQSHINR